MQVFSAGLPQSKHEEPVAGGDGDILLAMNRVSDGVHDHGATKECLPKQASVLSIQYDKITFPASGEQHIRRCSQDTAR